MKLVLASGNKHKANEIRAQIPAGFELISQTTLGIESPEETGSTFVENAIIKAKHASLVSGFPAIADDSGLCVPSLLGKPGLHSARYAGPTATDTENLEKLMSSLKGISDRRAFFHCVLVYMESADDPAPIITEGRWNGEISHSPSIESGFGYDPIFYAAEVGKTAAEITNSEKNTFSHRGQALRDLFGILSAKYAT